MSVHRPGASRELKRVTRSYDRKRPCRCAPAKPENAFISYDQLGAHRTHRFRGIWGCDAVTDDSDGVPTRVDGYEWRIREVNSSGADQWNGKYPTGVIVPKKGDPAVEFERVGGHWFHNKHYYESSWRAFNENGAGEWSDWSPKVQFLETVQPLAPTLTGFDVDQHKMHVKGTNPADDFNILIHHRHTFANVLQIATGTGPVDATGWPTSPTIKIPDEFHGGLNFEKHYKFPKPGSTTYYIRVGAKTIGGLIEWSNVLTGSLAVPPAPSTVVSGDLTWKRGGKHQRSLKINYSYSGVYTDDDIHKFGIEWQVEHRTLVSGDDWHGPRTHTFKPGETVSGHFVLDKLHSGDKIRFRTFVRDTKGHRSDYSATSATFTVPGKTPGPVTNVKTDPDGNAVIVSWDPPTAWDPAEDDPTEDFDPGQIDHFEVRLYRSNGTTLATYPAGHPTRAGQNIQDLNHKSLEKRFKVKGVGWAALGAPFKGKVKVVGHEDTTSTEVADTVGGSPEPTTTSDGVVPDTPTGLDVGPTSSNGELLAIWSALTNADPVTYEVWYKASSDFATPGSITGGTLAGEVSGTTFVLKNLTPGTTYYVRLRSKDADGTQAVASASDSGVPKGKPSDGVAPSTSPTPTLTAGYKMVLASWSAVTNNDPVTYEVHISTSSGFTPSGSTKVAEIDGTAFPIKALNSGAELAISTTYYVKLIAKDADGAAAAGSQASTTTLGVPPADFVAGNVIVQLTLTSGSIIVGSAPGQTGAITAGGATWHAGINETIGGVLYSFVYSDGTAGGIKFSVDAAGNVNVIGATITGGTFRTAASGSSRWEMTTGTADTIVGYVGSTIGGELVVASATAPAWVGGGTTHVFGLYSGAGGNGPRIRLWDGGLEIDGLGAGSTGNGIKVGVSASDSLGFLGTDPITKRADPGNVTGTADLTYGAVERDMINDSKTAINDIFGILRAYGFI